MRKPGRACTRPGCPGVVRDGECSSCGPLRRQRAATERHYDEERGSSSQRGYGRRWRRLRIQVLAAEPLCRECAERGLVVVATDVDHIVPKRNSGTDELSNLEPLCHSCHSRKTGSGQ